MNHTAKLFTNGRSQAVRLPAMFRFDTTEVFIYKDTETGNVILSRKPENWESFLSLLKETEVPDNFLNKADRQQQDDNRDPFIGWEE
jgi:antitoxin VapB